MGPCHVVEITTPNRFVLYGLWFGPIETKRVIVWVHGMFSSAFSMQHIIGLLIDKETAILTFNNRGHETVSEVKRIIGRRRKWIRAGTSHEIFTDCVDDIDGAMRFVKKIGAQEIFLAGHSTGSQKIVYWTGKQKGKGVKGLILLAPLSDFAGVTRKKQYPSALRLAKDMIRKGRRHTLLPPHAWWHYVDAQRFISLSTPESIEQSIFSYFDSRRPSRMLGSVKIPMLVILAGKDEYADRPAKEIIRWFERHSRAPIESLVAKGATHSFKNSKVLVAETIKRWISFRGLTT